MRKQVIRQRCRQPPCSSYHLYRNLTGACTLRMVCDATLYRLSYSYELNHQNKNGLDL